MRNSATRENPGITMNRESGGIMKKLAMLAAVALIAMGLTGCVQLHSDTVIAKDGSGTASLTISLSPAMQDLFKDMKDLEMDQDQDMDFPVFDDIKKDDLAKAAEGHGVKIKKFEKAVVNGREQLDIVMDFEDLEGLSYVMSNVMGEEPGDGMGIFETADGNFVLKEAHYDFPAPPAAPAAPAEGAEPAPEAESKDSTESPAMTDEEKAQKQMEVMGKMMGAMAELDVKFTITVPGEIIESNAPTVEGNTSIWAINASNMMSQQGQDMDPVITFSSKGLKIKPLKE